MKVRVGFGFDVHRLVEGRDLWLCGIKLDYGKGLLGHSDADVALHALADALLGAASLRDIGFHFPDSDEEYRGADSKKLLGRVIGLIREKGYAVGNVDITVCLEKPRLKEHIDEMRQCIAGVIGVDKEDVSVKATTTERLGFTGREEGIAAYAVALIEKI